MHDGFDRFTQRARKVLSLAQEEAQRFNHNYIGTEHLLLALIREGDGVAAKVLANLGVSLGEIREAVERIIGRGDRIVLGEIGLTPRAKKAIELAVDEASRLNHSYIGTEHLLLGLAREGSAARILASLGVTFERVRAQTIEILTRSSPSQAVESALLVSPPMITFTFTPPTPSMTVSISFSGLDQGAQHVLRLAHAEAQHRNQDAIDDEHILLGIVLESSSSAARALDQHGATIAAVRRALDSIKDVDYALPGQTGLTSRANVILSRARAESVQHGTPTVTPDHLLLGLLTAPTGAAVAALRQFGIDSDALYTEVSQHLRDGQQPDQPPE